MSYAWLLSEIGSLYWLNGHGGVAKEDPVQKGAALQDAQIEMYRV